VILVEYERPEVIVVGSAMVAVQGNDKHGGLQDVMPSTPAYEADE